MLSYIGFWIADMLECWNDAGMLVYWYHVLMAACWHAWMLEYLNAHMLTCLHAGMLTYWTTGIPEYWHTWWVVIWSMVGCPAWWFLTHPWCDIQLGMLSSTTLCTTVYPCHECTIYRIPILSFWSIAMRLLSALAWAVLDPHLGASLWLTQSPIIIVTSFSMTSRHAAYPCF